MLNPGHCFAQRDIYPALPSLKKKKNNNYFLKLLSPKQEISLCAAQRLKTFKIVAYDDDTIARGSPSTPYKMKSTLRHLVGFPLISFVYSRLCHLFPPTGRGHGCPCNLGHREPRGHMLG